MWWKSSPSQERRPPEPGQVIDHRTTPPGVVPRHLQQWVLIGVALVMVAILSLSGAPTKPHTSSVTAPAALSFDPNQQRIEEYQRRIQEQAQRLAAEQAQLQLAKDTAALSSPPPITPGSRTDSEHRAGASSTSSTTPPIDRANREERARFADNVAFSRPDGADGATHAGASMDAAAPATHPAQPAVAATAPSRVPAPARRTSESNNDASRYPLFEGSFIDTVLTNRIDGTFPGPVNCLVSVPVYASDQQHLVIPAGSRVLGEARAVSAFGQSRLAVVFHRVLLPNGTHIDLDGFHGLNQVGDLGLQDQVDRHYAQIFGVSLAIGAIAGLAQIHTNVGLDATSMDFYRQGVATNIAQSSARVLDRFLNLLPTVTIREGHRIKVYLSNDLELPAYTDASVPTGGRP
jgi:type IV secretory pathway VirB10-like protein